MLIAFLLVATAVSSAVGQTYCHRCTGGLLSNANDGGDRLQAPTRRMLVDPWTQGSLRYATYQRDDNFVLYSFSTGHRMPVWDAKSWSAWYTDASILRQTGQGQVIMQGDGNLVLVVLDRVVWSTETSMRGVGPYCLTLSMSCHLVILDSDCKTIWSVPSP
ncbi:Aste57867_22758 [Aphanomyces stellatus]|uniref:Aste57867_22758 protein n=1 Tax=Aphanomyces stellatus TaxID=120398 RepID=A0A485LLN6_9STRA|nr:hypothetical protein As57867_022688 [Aphanomyces stellatus]VFT99411.1 Aste57867_22758 [Aphanomyces stellatus]